jgi:hypothetical protein
MLDDEEIKNDFLHESTPAAPAAPATFVDF